MNTTQQQPVEAAPRRGWWRRNWKRLILGVILIVAVSAAGGYYYLFGRMLLSEPFKIAWDAVKNSKTVSAKLGAPVGGGWTPHGNINQDPTMTVVTMNFSISGPKGAADVAARAQEIGGIWSFTEFKVTPADGTEDLNLRSEANAGKPDDVQKFDPTKPQPKTTTTEEAPPDLNIKLDDVPSPPSGK
jgi:Cytochrome oxidase complex assembly protein 1